MAGPSRLSRTQRAARWCRYHPKAVVVGAAVIVVIGVIGSVTDDSGSEPADRAADSASASAPATSAASAMASTAGSTATRSAAATPGPTRVTAAPADRTQHSSRLASAVLATIAIKGRAPKTGYDRDRFGSAWTDDNDNPLGHNGCDTRNDVLRRDLAGEKIKPGTNGCVVLSGVLRDPYTARTIAFTRGVATSGAVQIDHVVSLSDAWQKGAQRYGTRTLTNIANDPLNLLAVDGPTNESKGDGDTATWLPPNTSYRCAYVARQIAVKSRYLLWMTRAEHDAAARVLRSCPRQTVPRETGAPLIELAPRTTPPARTTHRPQPTSPSSDVYYENCDAVRAAGAAPLHRGDPGYAAHLDRDGDGVACE